MYMEFVTEENKDKPILVCSNCWARYPKCLLEGSDKICSFCRKEVDVPLDIKSVFKPREVELCPECGSIRIYTLGSGRYKCARCKKTFARVKTAYAVKWNRKEEIPQKTIYDIELKDYIVEILKGGKKLSIRGILTKVQKRGIRIDYCRISGYLKAMEDFGMLQSVRVNPTVAYWLVEEEQD